MRSCLLVVGEKSGEEHALSFYDQLVKLCPETSFYGVGGDDLILKGFEALYHLKDFTSMGIIEVIRKFAFYLKALKVLENEVVNRKTKTAILVDFQDFNLMLAKRLRKKGVQVLYYVAPQAWAWREKRGKVLAKTIHTLFAILPFEKKWFQDRGVKHVKVVKHPLLEKYQKRLLGNQDILDQKFPGGKVRILLLPGSRKFEVLYLLPEFLWAISHLRKDYKLEVAMVKAQCVGEEVFSQFPYCFDHLYEDHQLADALEQADLCLAASGTVGLCSALFQVPTVVAYKLNLLDHMIFDTLIRYRGPYSLANIFHERWVFPELVQMEANGLNILRTLKLWLPKKVTTHTSCSLEANELYRATREQLKLTGQYLEGEGLNVAEYMSSVVLGEEK